MCLFKINNLTVTVLEKVFKNDPLKNINVAQQQLEARMGDIYLHIKELGDHFLCLETNETEEEHFGRSSKADISLEAQDSHILVERINSGQVSVIDESCSKVNGELTVDVNARNFDSGNDTDNTEISDDELGREPKVAQNKKGSKGLVNNSRKDSVNNSGKNSVNNSGKDSVNYSGKDSVNNSKKNSRNGSGKDSVNKNSVMKSERLSVNDSGKDSTNNSSNYSVNNSSRDSVMTSGKYSVNNSGKDSVNNSSQDSVNNSSKNSVGNSGKDSVINSVGDFKLFKQKLGDQLKDSESWNNLGKTGKQKIINIITSKENSRAFKENGGKQR